MQGVRAICKVGGEQLLHAIFATRSRQVLGELPERDASSYLSGLLVGSDVVGATALMRERIEDIAAVTLIGDSALSHCYRLALDHLGIDKAAVLGHSMGGMVASRFGMTYPETASHVVFVNQIGMSDGRPGRGQ